MASATRATTPQKAGDKSEDGKVINDPIHGTMYFNSLIIGIVDTVQFQRLRDIKQLGGTSFIYPGGTHTRFDHSLGTCHVTSIFLKYLKKRNPHISSVLTEKKMQCIEIAALCHDLGQGPFSRVYQDQFLGRLKETDWSHTENSLKLFDMITSQPAVKTQLQEFNDSDIQFIKAVIRGEPPDDDKCNRFLYEVVLNRRNGIDCDTFDKILRDCYYVGVMHSFNLKRVMESAKIVKVKDEWRLCLRYKEQLCVRELFDSWCKLQQFVYTHKTTRAIEMMIAEAMDKADNYFQISEARNYPGKFLMLSDSIFHQIIRARDDTDEGLNAAKELLQRVCKRELYRFCGQTSPLPTEEEASLAQSGRSLSFDLDGTLSPGAAERHRQNLLRQKVTAGILEFPKFYTDITEDDLLVEVIVIRYGNGRNDPLDNIDFVNKEGILVNRSPKSKGINGPTFMKAYQEEFIRVYARRSEKIKEIINRFYRWCEKNKYDVPKDMEKTPMENDERESMPACSARRRLQFEEDQNENMALDPSESSD